MWLEVEFQCSGREMVLLHVHQVYHLFDPEVSELLGEFMDVKVDDDPKLGKHASEVRLSFGMDKRCPVEVIRRVPWE